MFSGVFGGNSCQGNDLDEDTVALLEEAPFNEQSCEYRDRAF